MRDLTGPTQSRGIRDLLQSLLVLEAFQPSQPLWLLSAWVTDAPVVDNSGRQFYAVDPDWNSGPVVLSSVIRTIVDRGGRVNLITRDDDINAPFIAQMRRLQAQYSGRVRLALHPDFHDKGLLGDDFELSGSMNFTRRGIETNEEHLILRTDLATVAARHLTLNARWQERLSAPD